MELNSQVQAEEPGKGLDEISDMLLNPEDEVAYKMIAVKDLQKEEDNS